MGFFALFVGFFLLFLSVIHPIIYRPIAQKYDTDFSCLIISVWLMIGTMLSLPLMWGEFKQALPLVKEAPILALLAVAKGVVGWYTIKFRQFVNQKSTSSVMFYPFISLALTALVVNVFFEENLQPIYLMSIFCLGVLGFCFCLLGDASRLPLKWKIYMVVAIILTATCPTLDHVGIKKIGWYFYFVVSNTTMFLFSLLGGVTKKKIKLLFTSREVLSAGLVNTILEFTIIGSAVRILPVSISALFRRMAAPIVMVFSALKYKEKTIKNQFIFGVFAILFALPIIFLK